MRILKSSRGPRAVVHKDWWGGLGSGWIVYAGKLLRERLGDPQKADGPGLDRLSQWFGPLRPGGCGRTSWSSWQWIRPKRAKRVQKPPPLKFTGLMSSAPWWPQEAMVQALCFQNDHHFPR